MDDTNSTPELTPTLHIRPKLEDFDDPISFVDEMLVYRKKTERGFSVLKATASLRRVSPALVSLVVARKRTLTPDRADEFAKLLGLTAAEKHFFKAWISGDTLEARTQREAALAAPLKSAAVRAGPGSASADSAARSPLETKFRKNRKEVSTHILKDWLNLYVKDLFHMPDVQASPELAEKMLLHIASPARVKLSMQFLMREGHLRKTLEGKLVPETPLTVTDPKVPSQKIRQFHKAALNIAQKAIDRVPSTERNAVTMTLALNEKTYAELVEIIEEFGARLRDFAGTIGETNDGHTLYQFLINASPVANPAIAAVPPNGESK